MFHGGRKAVLLAAAADPHTPPDFLAELAGHRSMKIKLAVAANRSTPAEALTRLAFSRLAAVRFRVAGNPAASPAALNELAASHGHLRVQVAGHSHTEKETLDRLADDANPMVRRMVALNHNASLDTCARLAGDPNRAVSAPAEQRVEHRTSQPPKRKAARRDSPDGSDDTDKFVV